MAYEQNRTSSAGAAKRLARTLAGLAVLPVGSAIHALTGRTLPLSYQAMIWLFCASGGRSNDALSAMVSRLRPKLPLGDVQGVLGKLSQADAAAHAARLRQDGFLVFERALPVAVCDELLGFAKRTPAIVRRMDDEPMTADKRTALFDPEHLLGVRYDYEIPTLLNNAVVQSLLADRSLLSVAQEYLGCLPIADVLNMWWHTHYQARPDSEAAQFFHFDMDRYKWLKVFFYLTDVGPDNGPHMFIRGSHRTGGIPARFLRRGYARLSDDEVYAEYPEDRRIRFCAPRGTIILEDTRGLHKGAVVTGAPRAVLQLQFSNSLFGAHYPRAKITSVQDAALMGLLTEAPAIYKQYT